MIGRTTALARRRGWMLLAGLALAPACAGSYGAGLASVHDALAAGRDEAALEALNRRVAQAGPDHPDAPLWRLERAVVQVRCGGLSEAAGDLAAADGQLEVLDLTTDGGGELTHWLFSEAATRYKAPPYEKLLVNVLGLATRLAAADVAGARVEARRVDVLDRYFSADGADPGHAVKLARLLAGLAWEASGRTEAAARDYVVALGAAAAVAQARPAEGQGVLAVVTLVGAVPRREAKREQRSIAGRSVPLAVLTLGAGEAPAAPELRLDGGEPVAPALSADIAATARETFERARPALQRAAKLRASTRRAAGAAAEKGAGKRGWAALVGQVVEHGMAGADVPDTRGWTTLPARITVHRLVLPAGGHRLQVGADAREVEVTAGRITVIVATP